MSDEPGTRLNRWGPRDELGMLNAITPTKRLAALQVPQTGRLFNIGYGLASGEPVQTHKPAPTRTTVVSHNEHTGRGSFDEVLTMHVHAGTHIDALCHYWTGDGLYNGHPLQIPDVRGAPVLSIDRVKGIVTRAVLLDVGSACARDSSAWGREISVGELEAALEVAACKLEPGDAVLIRTGWSEVWNRDRETYLWGEPGIGVDAAIWLAEHEVALVGADNWAVEAIPPRERSGLAVHATLLGIHGVLLMENLRLEELATEAGPGPYLLVVAPLQIAGGSGSPINPIVVA